MNKATPIVLLLLSIALGALAIYEYQQAEYFETLVAQLKKDASAAREEADTNTAEIRKLKEQTRVQKVAITQLEERNRELVSAGPGEPGATPATASSGEQGSAKGGDFLKSMAKMFNDPKMKEAMRAQQGAAITMMYGSLAQELGLAPEEARQVLALLTDRQIDMAGKGMAAMSKGAGDPRELATMGKESEATKSGYDEQLKAILGPEKFAKFQEYEKSTGERMVVDQVQKQFAAAGMTLDPSQSQGLLAIMKEERVRTPALAKASDPAAQMKMIQSEEGMNLWLQTQQDFNRRVLDRARTVLSPDQILTFEAAQKQQLEMQRMGVQMSREMLKGQK